MRRILAVILVLMLYLGYAACLQAAESDSLAVKVSILGSLGVDIAEAELNLGSVEAGSTTTSASAVTVTNTGSGIAETYSLSLTNPTGWTASQTEPGAEIYVLNAGFDLDGSLAWETTNHALSTTPTVCTNSKFAGDQTGVGVAYGATRKLWFQFLAPTATGLTTEQSITLTISAQAD